MFIQRAKNITLHEAGQNFSTGRSFHLGNLTIRDMLPVAMGCYGETFDLNMLSDSAYFPQKITYKNRISDILLENESDYVATSTLAKPPQIGQDHNMQNFVDQAFEESKTLGGFWMRINEGLNLGEFKTLSSSLSHHKHLVRQILQKISDQLSPEKFASIRGRYIAYNEKMGHQLLNFSHYEGNKVIYISTNPASEAKNLTIAIDRNDIVDQALSFFNHRSQFTKPDVDLKDTFPQAHWPLFANEVTTLLLFLIEAQTNKQGKVYHIWGQAMYGYIRASKFLDRFHELLSMIDDDHNITNGIQLNGLEILPAHFFRLAGYRQELLDNLGIIFDGLNHIDQLHLQKGELFKQKLDHTNTDVQQLNQQIKLLQQQQEQLYQNLAQEPEFLQMPYPTLREWTLCEPYHSQLDLYAEIKQGFNPQTARKFLAEQPLDRIQKVMDKVITLHKPKK